MLVIEKLVMNQKMIFASLETVVRDTEKNARVCDIVRRHVYGVRYLHVILT